MGKAPGHTPGTKVKRKTKEKKRVRHEIRVDFMPFFCFFAESRKICKFFPYG